MQGFYDYVGQSHNFVNTHLIEPIKSWASKYVTANRLINWQREEDLSVIMTVVLQRVLGSVQNVLLHSTVNVLLTVLIVLTFLFLQYHAYDTAF